MEENITQQNVEANPVIDTGANILPQNEGEIGNTQPQVEPEKVNEGKTYSQKDLDNIAAKARGAAERETRRKLLAQLGINSDDEDTLARYREAYENSLTEEEVRLQEIDDLNEENINLMVELDEKDYIIQALIALSGKTESDVEKIVKMAKGLKTEDNSIADCVKDVLSVIRPAGNQQPQGVGMPVGQSLTQPSTTMTINANKNPFKQGQINLTEQGKLIRENPVLAKRLMAEAGYDKINI